MINWQDKYKDLKVGESAWYWHTIGRVEDRIFRKIIKVSCVRSMQDGTITYCNDGEYRTSEYYPNGPRCMTPEEIEKLISINVLANSDDC
jgi:hypothetical protein